MKTWEDVKEVIGELRKGQLKRLKRYCNECDRQTEHVQREGPVENTIGWMCAVCGWIRED